MKKALLSLTLTALFAVSVSAEDTDSEKERLRKAKAEQKSQRIEEQEAAAAEALEREQAEEKLRLEELGVAEDTMHEADKGFFVHVSALLADHSGAGRAVATTGDISTTATNATDVDLNGDQHPDNFTMANLRDVRIEYDAELSPEIEIGWRRGTGAGLSLRFWSFSSSSSASASGRMEFLDGADPGLVIGAIDNRGYENTAAARLDNPQGFARPYGASSLLSQDLTGADSVTADGSFDARRFDLSYLHSAVVKSRLELHYRAGITWIQTEREEQAEFTWTSFSAIGSVQRNATVVEDVQSRSDGDGLGLVVGISGRYGLSSDRRWTLWGGLELSGIKYSQELEYEDRFVLTQEGVDPFAELLVDTNNDRATEVTTTIDAQLAVEVRLGEQARVALGYRHATWVNGTTFESYPNSANVAQLVSQTEDLRFSGPFVRLSWFF